MDLREKTLAYYLDNFAALPQDKQFHFATRVAAWLGTPPCLQHLQAMKATIVPSPYTKEAVSKTLASLINNPPSALINAASRREPFFARYPELRGIDFALFRVRHMKEVYGLDSRETLLDIKPASELLSLEQALMKDPEATQVLSTYAINFFYLLHKCILNDDAIDRVALYELGKHIDSTNPERLQLLIYLYTHCIIGETNFYAQHIPAEHLSIYQSMLAQLEPLIRTHFDQINLDNKLEFLVCSRICNFSTDLQERVEAECNRSISNEGTFVVDRHNANAQSSKTSFGDSEHRNVLFIMSGSPYKPHSTRVS